MKVIVLPAAERYLKKLKDKQLKDKFKAKVLEICEDPMIGDAETGDLAGVRSCDIYHNKTNCELAYHVVYEGDERIVIMAGTRENLYEALMPYWKRQKRIL